MNKPRYLVTPADCSRKTLPDPYEIFVFGSNTEGRHGAGSARTAVTEFNAVMGQSMGLQGRAYGIITKCLRVKDRNTVEYKSRMISLIKSQVFTLYKFAELRPDLHFYVSAIGTGLGGFYTVDIAPIFHLWTRPKNVILCSQFMN